ncbi:SusD/RagB family nutrient-binding outer membrane lipoprotein [Chitinophaga barathri]|uniref:SusD/RagB family nutrient-binding outer membrane lipoprotein n=1 Tax=Chitinophaga barathri TaxID=1647451 RepID=A0A3N4M5A9_9BACT|nr:SusD/RagB family nutrient-binding outer membrane lipoprotein [Chitinophaga barathri]RPD38198.1 SusD/RagB family nutrient-binding outer membrane lipoprotein [Chitinophaga barathri]
MKRIFIILFFLLTVLAGCKKWLDVNSDPDTPQNPDAASVFPTQLAGIPRGTQYDARYIGRYIQNWNSDLSTRAADVNFDRMGYTGASDANGDIWRQTYFGLGQNLRYIITVGRDKGQWDYVGAAYALMAFMFQSCTDHHGEIIFTEAFKENTAIFKFDGQDTVYNGVRVWCDSALFYLNRTDLNPANNKLSRGDYALGGSNQKWIKFVNGILARNYNHLSNKTIYDPAKVIAYCNASLASIDDDFMIPFDATKNDDTNFFGPYRNNLTFFRQSNFIVQLLDGTILAGDTSVYENRDPRIRHMLSTSNDTTNGNGGYRGVDPGAGDPNASGTANARKRVAVPWGDSIYENPSANVFTPNGGKYLFRDKVVSPVMTYSEIQFIKAEAAYRMADYTTALAAYTEGIKAHFAFINNSKMPRNNNVLYNGSTISNTQRDIYLNSPNVKRTAADLTMADIMLQKYIALWGWGFTETWVDMRRFYYGVIPDPRNGLPVYKGFVLPATLSSQNLGLLVCRARPRYNSEYVWNQDELARIGALEINYHTKPMWFMVP